MPTYEYRCNACQKQFEYVQSMKEDAKTVCESCGEEALERLISASSFHLKGGGWYSDLYSSSSSSSSAGTKSSTSESSSESKGTTSSESSSSAKADS